MSAFIVSTRHIAYLAEAIAKWTDEKRSFEAIGQTLLNENYRAVNYRYHETDTAPEYRHYPSGIPLTPIQVIKAVSCLQDQLAEPPDYQQTDAYRLLDNLLCEAIRKLPGYEQARWEIPQ